MKRKHEVLRKSEKTSGTNNKRHITTICVSAALSVWAIILLVRTPLVQQYFKDVEHAVEGSGFDKQAFNENRMYRTLERIFDARLSTTEAKLEAHIESQIDQNMRQIHQRVHQSLGETQKSMDRLQALELTIASTQQKLTAHFDQKMQEVEQKMGTVIASASAASRDHATKALEEARALRADVAQHQKTIEKQFAQKVSEVATHLNKSIEDAARVYRESGDQNVRAVVDSVDQKLAHAKQGLEAFVAQTLSDIKKNIDHSLRVAGEGYHEEAAKSLQTAQVLAATMFANQAQIEGQLGKKIKELETQLGQSIKSATNGFYEEASRSAQTARLLLTSISSQQDELKRHVQEQLTSQELRIGAHLAASSEESRKIFEQSSQETKAVGALVAEQKQRVAHTEEELKSYVGAQLQQVKESLVEQSKVLASHTSRDTTKLRDFIAQQREHVASSEESLKSHITAQLQQIKSTLADESRKLAQQSTKDLSGLASEVSAHKEQLAATSEALQSYVTAQLQQVKGTLRDSIKAAVASMRDQSSEQLLAMAQSLETKITTSEDRLEKALDVRMAQAQAQQEKHLGVLRQVSADAKALSDKQESILRQVSADAKALSDKQEAHVAEQLKLVQGKVDASLQAYGQGLKQETLQHMQETRALVAELTGERKKMYADLTGNMRDIEVRLSRSLEELSAGSAQKAAAMTQATQDMVLNISKQYEALRGEFESKLSREVRGAEERVVGAMQAHVQTQQTGLARVASAADAVQKNLQQSLAAMHEGHKEEATRLLESSKQLAANLSRAHEQLKLQVTDRMSQLEGKIDQSVDAVAKGYEQKATGFMQMAKGMVDDLVQRYEVLKADVSLTKDALQKQFAERLTQAEVHIDRSLQAHRSGAQEEATRFMAQAKELVAGTLAKQGELEGRIVAQVRAVEEKLGSSIVALAAGQEAKATSLMQASKDLTAQLLKEHAALRQDVEMRVAALSDKQNEQNKLMLGQQQQLVARLSGVEVHIDRSLQAHRSGAQEEATKFMAQAKELVTSALAKQGELEGRIVQQVRAVEEKLGSSIVALAAGQEAKATSLMQASKDLTAQLLKEHATLRQDVDVRVAALSDKQEGILRQAKDEQNKLMLGQQQLVAQIGESIKVTEATLRAETEKAAHATRKVAERLAMVQQELQSSLGARIRTTEQKMMTELAAAREAQRSAQTQSQKDRELYELHFATARQELSAQLQDRVKAVEASLKQSMTQLADKYEQSANASGENKQAIEQQVVVTRESLKQHFDQKMQDIEQRMQSAVVAVSKDYRNDIAQSLQRMQDVEVRLAQNQEQIKKDLMASFAGMQQDMYASMDGIAQRYHTEALGKSQQAYATLENRFKQTYQSLKGHVSEKVNAIEGTVQNMLAASLKDYTSQLAGGTASATAEVMARIAQEQEKLKEHVDATMRNMQGYIDSSVRVMGERYGQDIAAQSRKSDSLFETQLQQAQAQLAGHVERKIGDVEAKIQQMAEQRGGETATLELQLSHMRQQLKNNLKNYVQKLEQRVSASLSAAVQEQRAGAEQSTENVRTRFEQQLKSAQNDLMRLLEQKLQGMQKSIDDSVHQVQALKEDGSFKEQFSSSQAQMKAHLDNAMKEMQQYIDSSIQAAAQQQQAVADRVSQHTTSLVEKTLSTAQSDLQLRLDQRIKLLQEKIDKQASEVVAPPMLSTEPKHTTAKGEQVPEIVDPRMKEYIAQQVRKKIRQHMVLAPEQVQDDEVYDRLRKRGQQRAIRRVLRDMEDDY